VPLAVDLRRANADRGLAVVSLSGLNQQQDVAADHFLKVAEELGIEHAQGEASYFGEYTPYFNLNHMSSTTYCFVISRSGVVVWHGDPSTHGEEFLEALARALAEPGPPPLAEGFAADAGELVRPAALAYGVGDYGRAREEAERMLKRQGRRKEAEARAAVAAAEELLVEIDAHRDALQKALDDAWERKDAGAFHATAEALARGYPRTPAAAHAMELRKRAGEEAAFAAALEALERWNEVVRERPLLWPARVEPDGKRFARKLEKYLASVPEDAPGVATGRRWLGLQTSAR
jgi:hypothetical protein